MSDSNGSGLSWLDEMLLRATEEEQQLIDQRGELMSRVQAVDDALRRISRVRRAAEGQAAVSPRRRPSRATSRAPSSSADYYSYGPKGIERLVAILGWILESAGDRFSGLEIHEGIDADWGESQTYSAVNELRRREIIAKAGAERHGPTATRTMYRLIDRRAAKNLMEELSGAAAK